MLKLRLVVIAVYRDLQILGSIQVLREAGKTSPSFCSRGFPFL